MTKAATFVRDGAFNLWDATRHFENARSVQDLPKA